MFVFRDTVNVTGNLNAESITEDAKYEIGTLNITQEVDGLTADSLTAKRIDTGQGPAGYGGSGASAIPPGANIVPFAGGLTIDVSQPSHAFRSSPLLPGDTTVFKPTLDIANYVYFVINDSANNITVESDNAPIVTNNTGSNKGAIVLYLGSGEYRAFPLRPAA